MTPLPDDIRTTFFTVANRPYEHFVLPYIVSVLIHNDDSRVEICVEEPDRFMKENKKALRVLKQHTASSRYLIRKGDFRASPNSVRFLETPEVRTEYVYITDIDMLILGKATDYHISEMYETGLPYFNLVQMNKTFGPVLTGMHFTRFDAFYPVSIPEGTDVGLDLKLLYDMICAKGHGLPPFERKDRERHAIHISYFQLPTPDAREQGKLTILDTINSYHQGKSWKLKNYRALWSNGVWREMFPLFDPRYRALVAIIELCIANAAMSEANAAMSESRSMKLARTLNARTEGGATPLRFHYARHEDLKKPTRRWLALILLSAGLAFDSLKAAWYGIAFEARAAIHVKLASLVCLIAIFVSLYHPALINDYAYFDDYSDFLGIESSWGAGKTGLGWVFERKFLEGRPIYAGIYYVIAEFVETLFDVRWIRLFGIFGIALASWCVFREFVRQEFDRLPSFLVAVAVGMSVPFQMAGAWATVSLFPYAFAITYAAFRIAEHSLKQRTTIKYALIVASIICLLMAFYIYQPVALAFWAFFAIGILRKQTITGNDIRRAFVYLCITAAAIGLSYLTYQIAHGILPYGGKHDRTGLVAISDIPERISWLIKRMAAAVVFPVTPNEYYADAFRYFADRSRSVRVSELLPLVVVLAGLVLYFRDRPSFMKRCVIACTLPILCHGIMFVSAEGDGQRSRMALSFLVIVYLFLAVHGYARYIARYINRTPSAFVNCVMGFVVFGGVALSYWHHERQFVRANVREIEYIRSELQQHDLKRYGAIHVVRPKCRGGTFVSRGYLKPSGCGKSSASDMVKFLLIDLHADTHPLGVSNFGYYGDGPVPHTNTLVIDMEKGVRAYRATRE